jgi:hypothetical protein
MLPEIPERYEGLYRFFRRWTGAAFGDLGLSDAQVADYVSGVLTRFARTENLYRIRDLRGQRLTTVVDMLLEAEEHARPAAPRFDPFREREIRRHIGDFTLFMTGILRDYVERMGVMDLYTREGERSYYSVYEFDSSLSIPGSELFRRLFLLFERVAGALDYMRKVYFRPEMHTGPYRPLLERLSQW